MPEHRGQYVQLIILLLALPAQYFLTQWYGANSNTLRISNLHELTSSVKSLASYTEKILMSIAHHISAVSILELELRTQKKLKSKTAIKSLRLPYGESVAQEIFKYRSTKQYFAQSTAVRSPRPAGLNFRVGQVIKHNVFGYRGVIIGWDSRCKAPISWTKALYGEDKTDLEKPHYLILIDIRDRPDAQITYVAQDKVTSYTNVKIVHPNLWDYFDLYDGAQFHMRPAIYQMYPHDWTRSNSHIYLFTVCITSIELSQWSWWIFQLSHPTA